MPTTRPDSNTAPLPRELAERPTPASWAAPHARRLLRFAIVVQLAFFASTAPAGMYKCPRPGGGVEYTDAPCGANPGAHQWRPRHALNVVTSESLTGRKATPKDARPGWFKPLDPIGDCRRAGGEFDPEFRACKMP